MKLTYQEANNLVCFAYEQQRNNPYIRLGQAIMNNLPKEVANNLVWGESDFYYFTDEDKVLESFYNECVEG